MVISQVLFELTSTGFKPRVTQFCLPRKGLRIPTSEFFCLRLFLEGFAAFRFFAPREQPYWPTAWKRGVGRTDCQKSFSVLCTGICKAHITPFVLTPLSPEPTKPRNFRTECLHASVLSGKLISDWIVVVGEFSRIEMGRLTTGAHLCQTKNLGLNYSVLFCLLHAAISFLVCPERSLNRHESTRNNVLTARMRPTSNFELAIRAHAYRVVLVVLLLNLHEGSSTVLKSNISCTEKGMKEPNDRRSRRRLDVGLSGECFQHVEILKQVPVTHSVQPTFVHSPTLRGGDLCFE